jgi:hypothetical protein
MRPGLHIARCCAALAVLAVLGLAVVESPPGARRGGRGLLLRLVPVGGSFPGVVAIARARAPRLRARPFRAPGRTPRPVLPDVARPVGFALAFALAMRPPPAAAPSH